MKIKYLNLGLLRIDEHCSFPFYVSKNVTKHNHKIGDNQIPQSEQILSDFIITEIR